MNNNSSIPTIYRYIFITLLLLAVYGNTLNHGFVWDDNSIIVNNPLLEKLENIPRLFIIEDNVDGPMGYYRPITYVSFGLVRAVWGLNPVGYNVANLALHILVVLLFYRVVATLFKIEDLAFLAALLFALHPLAGETVNFHAGGHNTLLCACFAMLSLLFYITNRHLPAIVCFTLAIFSKEFALLLPAVFLLHDKRIRHEKIRWQNYLPYILITICYLFARSLFVSSGDLLHSINFSESYLVVPQIVATYLKNMLFPFNLKTLYDLDTPISWTRLTVCYVSIITIISSAVVFRKRNEILFSLCLFLLFLLPVSNIFYLGIAKMADRYAYFSLFGFSLALAYCICLAKQQLKLLIIVVVCLFYITIDIKRNGFWKDEISLFTQMTYDAPEMFVGYQNLGVAYFDKQDLPNADKYLTLAYSQKSISSSMLIGSAVMFLEMNKPDKAILALEKKTRYEPDIPQSYIMLSTIYEELGNKALAASNKDKAVRLNPEVSEIMKKRAVAACRQGEELLSKHNFVAAAMLFREALTIDPLFVPALIGMGSLSFEKGDLTKSMQYLARAIDVDPLNPAPHHNLSLVYEKMGKTAESRTELIKFKELSSRSRQNDALDK